MYKIEPRWLSNVRFYAQPSKEYSVGLDIAGLLFKESIRRLKNPSVSDKGLVLDPEVVDHNYRYLKLTCESMNSNLKKIHLNVTQLAEQPKV